MSKCLDGGTPTSAKEAKADPKISSEDGLEELGKFGELGELGKFGGSLSNFGIPNSSYGFSGGQLEAGALQPLPFECFGASDNLIEDSEVYNSKPFALNDHILVATIAMAIISVIAALFVWVTKPDVAGAMLNPDADSPPLVETSSTVELSIEAYHSEESVSYYELPSSMPD